MSAQIADLRHRRTAFPFPRYQELDEADRLVLQSMDDLVPRLAERSAPLGRAGLERAFDPDPEILEQLRHRLSEHFSVPAAEGSCERSFLEWRTLQSHSEAIRSSLAADCPRAFTAMLTAVASEVAGVEDLRQETVRTTADSEGRFVEFAPWQAVEFRLAYLHRGLRSKDPRPASFDAVVTLVALTHCHPFRDGNGRTARILFNALLQRDLPAPLFYLPVAEAALAARGGYIVRVRQAELHRDWSALFRFMLAAMRYWDRALELGPAE